MSRLRARRRRRPRARGQDRPAARAARRRRAGGRRCPVRSGRAARRDPRLRRAAPARARAARRRANGRAPGRARPRRVLRAANGAHIWGLAAMIVTVTLNAALDRTLTVPNFQRGQRHRASQALDARGRQGDQRRPRAEAARRAGGRDRSRRRAAPASRIVEELTGEAILNDFVRIDDESRTSTAVVDPTARHVHGDQRVGPGGQRRRSSRCCSRSSPTLAQGADAVVFAGSLPRDVDDGFYDEAIRELNRRRRHDGARLRRRSRCGSASRPSRASSRRTSARPRALVGQEFNDDEDFLAGARRDRRARRAERPDHPGSRAASRSSAQERTAHRYRRARSEHRAGFGRSAQAMCCWRRSSPLT